MDNILYQSLSEEAKAKYDAQKVRLFFRGKELSEAQKLLSYKIENNCYIEVM